MANAFNGGQAPPFFQMFDARALRHENLSFWEYVPNISLAVRWYKKFYFSNDRKSAKTPPERHTLDPR